MSRWRANLFSLVIDTTLFTVWFLLPMQPRRDSIQNCLNMYYLCLTVSFLSLMHFSFNSSLHFSFHSFFNSLFFSLIILFQTEILMQTQSKLEARATVAGCNRVTQRCALQQCLHGSKVIEVLLAS